MWGVGAKEGRQNFKAFLVTSMRKPVFNAVMTAWEG